MDGGVGAEIGAQGIGEIALLEGHRTGECGQCFTRESERRWRQIHAVVVRDPCSGEGSDRHASVAAGDVEKAERSARFLDEDAMKRVISLLVKQVVVVDHLSVDLPLVAENLRGGRAGIGITSSGTSRWSVR